MLTLINRLLKDNRNILLLFCLAGVLLIWFYVEIFPLIEQHAEEITGLMEIIPKGMLKAFGVDDLDIFTLEGFLSYKHYSNMMPLMMIILFTALAASGLTGQIEKGTIEILLSCPVSRLKIFMGLYLIEVFALTVFIVCSVATIVPICELSGCLYDSGFHLSVALLSMFFGWAVFSLAMMISSIFSELRKAYLVFGAILFSMYIIYVISGLVNSLSWLGYSSLFYYFNIKHILLTGEIPLNSIHLFCIFSVLTSLTGLVVFNRRDISG
jgi:ABC-2 type transport system permease protein